MLICITDTYNIGNIYGNWDNETNPIKVDSPDFQIKQFKFYILPVNHAGFANIVFSIKHQHMQVVDDKLEKYNINHNIIKYKNISNVHGYQSGNIKYCIIDNLFRFYENDSLIIECYMKNNIPHGEYVEKMNDITFKGIMKHGVINGIGSEFYSNGKLKCNGFYINKIKNGKFIEYNEDGIEIYNGNYINNLKHKDGIEKYLNGNTKYHGWFQNNKYHDEGTLYYENGKIMYDGNFQNGMYFGSGKQYFENGNVMYEGNFQNNTFNGKGKEYDEQGILIYEGEYKNGVYNGQGKEYENGLLIYEGEFLNGYYDGIGTLYNNKSRCYYKIYEGEFINGHYDGHGIKYVMINGIVKKTYEGEFKKSHLNGIGILYKGERMYNIEYFNGRRYTYRLIKENTDTDDYTSDDTDDTS